MNNVKSVPAAIQEADVPAAAVRPQRRVVQALLLLLILANVACLGYYLFHGYQYHFHSDSAAANLLAQEIYESGEYFPRDWNYANGDLWVFLMHIWILVLLPFFENGYMLHAAGAVIGCVLTGFATWGLGTILGMSTRAKLFSIALLSAGLTPSMSEHVFGQQAYGTTYYTSGALLFSAWRYVTARGSVRWGWAASTVVLVVLVAWANPQRAAIYFILPLMAGIAALLATPAAATPVSAHAAAGARPPRSRLAGLFAIAVAGALIGALLHRHTVAHTLNFGKFPVVWLDFSGMVGNLERVLHGLVAVIGGTPTPNAPIASPTGVVEALRMVAALAVIVLAPYALARCLRSRHAGRAFVAAAAAASCGVTLFIALTSSLAMDGGVELSMRYLVPGILLVLLVLVTYVAQYSDTRPSRRAIAAAALGVLVLSAPIAYDIVKVRERAAAGGASQAIPKMRLLAFLRAQGLQYGYASFWNAGQLTVLSDGAVTVRQIQFDDRMPVPMRHLSSNRWYEPDAWKGPTFLLLTKEEAAKADMAEVFAATGEPSRRLEFEEFQIFVIDHNLARDFPSWRARVTEPVQFLTTSRTPHAIGRFDPATRALVAEKGEGGALRFGPYQRLMPGPYLVTFHLRIEGSGPADYGKVDVVANSGQRNLGARAVAAPGEQRITVPVAFNEVADAVEFRVFTTGAGKMSVMNVELANDDRRK